MGTITINKDEMANCKIGRHCCICGGFIEVKNCFVNNICEDCCKSLKEIINEHKSDKALKGEK